MRVALLLLFLLAEFTLSARAQVFLRGRVVDSARGPIEGAQVQLFDLGKKLPFDFQSTNGKGEFRFRVKQPRTVRLEIRAMGREEFSHEVALPSEAGREINLGDVLLVSSFEEISEVHVEADMAVKRRGDTVAFRVGSLAQGNEKSIAEVIGNIPGMKIGEDGRFRYLGREVERVMVGGVDMFGRNYQLLTQNLDPTAVREVQVIEHFEENRLMRKHRGSERVAMNFALEPGHGALVGTLRAAYGYRHVHDAQASLIGIFNKLQLNVLANSNQVGVSPASSSAAWQSPRGLSDISGGDFASVAGSSGSAQLTATTTPQGEQAPLGAQRRRRNMSHMLSAGAVYTPSSRFRMSVSGVGQLERDRYDSELQSEWQLEGVKLRRNEASHRESRTYVAGARLTLEGQASEMSDLRYDGGYSTIGERNVSEGEHGENKLRESIVARWQRTDHTLLYTHSFDSAGLLRGGVEWQSQWIDPRYSAQTQGPTPLGFTTLEGIATNYAEQLHFGRTRWVYLAPIYGGLTGDVRMGSTYTNFRFLASDLWTDREAYSLSHIDTYLGGSVSYTYKVFKAQTILLGHARRQAFEEQQRGAIGAQWSYYVEPQLTLQVAQGEHLGVLTYSYNTSFSSLLALLPRPVLTNFRQSYTGESTFRVHYGHSAMAMYSYGLPTSRIAAEGWLLYTFNPNPGTQRNVVAENRTASYVLVGKQSDQLVANLSGDFFASAIMTNFKLEAQGRQGHYTQYVNDQALDIRSRQIFGSLTIRTSVRGIMDVQVGANWTTVCFDTDGSRSLHHEMAQFVDAQVYVGPVRLNAAADRIEIGLTPSHSNAIYFLDAGVEWEVIKDSLKLYLEGRNLLNNRYYSQRSENNVEVAQMRYEIAPLQVLGGVRWQF